MQIENITASEYTFNNPDGLIARDLHSYAVTFSPCAGRNASADRFCSWKGANYDLQIPLRMTLTGDMTWTE